MKHYPKLSTIYQIVALLVTVVAILMVFPHQQNETHYDYTVGGFWRDNDLFAPFNFNVTLSDAEMDKALNEARAKSILYYSTDSTAHLRAIMQLNKLAANGTINAAQQRGLRKSVDSIYAKGYIERPSDIPDIENHTLVMLSGNIGREIDLKEHVTSIDISNQLLLDSILIPNIKFDNTRTQLELDSRLSQMAYSSLTIQTGELIIAKGERVTEEKAQTIAALDKALNAHFSERYSFWGRLAGQAGLCLIALIALYMFLANIQHPILEDNKKITLVLTIILLMAAATALVVRYRPDWVLVVPICIAPILMRIFFDMRVALYIHITTVVILASLVPNSYEFIFYQLITGMMSIISVRNFETRSKFFVVGLVIFVTYSLIYTSGVLSQESNFDSINPQRYLVFFSNALLTLFAYPLIYLIEKTFGMTSSLTLLEISSTNTPALRELSRKAPGTFQHSMQVANISEDLINEIGGYSLLAKVGALYHDIGKILAPLNFTENQSSEFNPHNDLDYEESARLITRHVTDGIELAHKYHLPAVVIDFIRTHHGTTYTGYFYAKQKAEHPDEALDMMAFRYPGPTPYTREMAVVMMVDSVEAACKSIKEHTQENINNMVDKVILDKVEGGQLNNCNLTFADISKIRQILKNRMMSIYHTRIAYPTVKQ